MYVPTISSLLNSKQSTNLISFNSQFQLNFQCKFMIWNYYDCETLNNTYISKNCGKNAMLKNILFGVYSYIHCIVGRQVIHKHRSNVHLLKNLINPSQVLPPLGKKIRCHSMLITSSITFGIVPPYIKDYFLLALLDRSVSGIWMDEATLCILTLLMALKV